MDPDTRAAPTGMVCSVDHLASGAGVALLRAGGSAADAAVAASAVVAVTCPHMCGLGGDLFALVHTVDDAEPHALDASGRTGSGADADALRAEGHTEVPFSDDIRATPVPGCVDGWLALHERFGRLPLADVLAPARHYAADGFPASPLLALATTLLVGRPGAADLLPEGRPARPGERLHRPGVARALDAIVAEGRAAFYEGEFGAGLLALGEGLYTEDDLRTPTGDWVAPLVTRVWGHDLWTMPPASQGYLTLLGAAIAEGLPLPDDPDDGDWAHLLVEAARAAAHDRVAVLHEGADVRPLLAAGEIERRRALVDPARRATLAVRAAAGDTIYLCAVDGARMGVSLIQSNAAGFGTGLFEPSTGVNLQNRAIGFSLEPGHPAEYGPRRRPPHTLSPALVTEPGGSLRAVIGTMGGDSQPQVLLQLLTRLLRHGARPGEAVAAPRWVLSSPSQRGFDTWHDLDATTVQLETTCPAAWVDGLARLGHTVRVVPPGPGFGHAHVIEAGDVLAGAADPRAEVGAAAGY